MSNTALFTLIKAAMPELFLKNEEPMSAHCSFRIGGAAEVFAEPASEGELSELLALAQRAGARAIIIGNGTNVLFDDAGVRGVVIKLGERLSDAKFREETVTAAGGITLSRLAVLAQQHALSGMEFAHGIPGSLGGGVVMNAGAYGGELKDIVSEVRTLDCGGAAHAYAGADCGFGYRHSRFSSGGEVVVGATLRLKRGDPGEIGARQRALMEKRSASQPLDKPSAGSTFKRPKTGYAAAMIDEAGLRGYSVGGAQVSEKHAGFVINTGNATFGDVCAVMEHVRETVLARFAVELEPEVRIIRG